MRTHPGVRALTRSPHRVLAHASTLLKTTLLYLLVAVPIGTGIVSSFPVAGSLKDFGSFVASGRAASEGLNPYEIYQLTFGGIARNLNPPVSVLAFQSISQLDPEITRLAWYVVSLVLYLLTVVLLVRAFPERVTPLRMAWVLGLAGFWSTLDLGQIYMPLLLASTAAWLLLRSGRYVWAGLLIGFVIAIKPNLAVWPLLLLVGGCWPAALAAVASAALLSLAPLVVYGPGIYASWLEVLPSTGVAGTATNASLAGLLDRFHLTFLGLPLTAVLLLLLAIWVWRRRPSILRVSDFGLLASLLSSPIAWAGYTPLLLPIFFRRKWTRPLGLAAALLLFPAGWSWTLSDHWPPWPLLTFGSVYGWALLILLGGLVAESPPAISAARPLHPPRSPVP